MPTRTTLRLAVAVLITAIVGCSGSTAEPEDSNGLRPGSYSLVFEIFPTISTPEEALGRHRIVFRVKAPGTSSSDFEVVSSERRPPTGPSEENYLTVLASETSVEENRWIVRFGTGSGAYTVSFSMGNAGFGDFQVLAGCFVRLPAGQTFQGSGCVVDRV